MKIVTHYWAKPIPTNKFDWEAHIDGQEEEGPYGYGATEDEAVQDLKDWIEVEEDCRATLH